MLLHLAQCNCNNIQLIIQIKTNLRTPQLNWDEPHLLLLKAGIYFFKNWLFNLHDRKTYSMSKRRLFP